jgi:hypothetical protein
MWTGAGYVPLWACNMSCKAALEVESRLLTLLSIFFPCYALSLSRKVYIPATVLLGYISKSAENEIRP